MNLIFTKNEEGVINLQLNTKDGIVDFSYIKMIHLMLDGDKLEVTKYIGEIDEDEQEKVNEMVRQIQTAVGSDEEPIEDEVGS